MNENNMKSVYKILHIFLPLAGLLFLLEDFGGRTGDLVPHLAEELTHTV